MWKCAVGELTAYLVITQLGPMFEPALISKATAHCKQQANEAENSPFVSNKMQQMLSLKHAALLSSIFSYFE